MTTIDCPWCEAPIEIDLPSAVEITCDACRIHVELAADPTPPLAAAA